MVARFSEYSDSTADCFCEMKEDELGEYVDYEAYAELEATIVEMQAEHESTIAEMQATIAELEQLADPLTKALYKEMSERHTAVCLKNKALREAVKHLIACRDKRLGSLDIDIPIDVWNAILRIETLLEGKADESL